MKIALTGGSGRIGRAVAADAIAHGHTIVNIDQAPPVELHANIEFIAADIQDYDALVQAFRGCDALIHMAAIPAPIGHLDHTVHNNNVVGSYNALRAAVEVGIRRICQASSVNAIGLSFSRKPRFDYFPLDEKHASYVEEPYSLSKWICEQQADSFARRYEDVRIASMRFHLVVPERADAAKLYAFADEAHARHLWAYTRSDAAARACLLSLQAPIEGHEVFYIVAPDTVMDVPSLDLASRLHAGVPITGDLSGNRSFFNCSKAEHMLGWTHPRG
jgi:nucleoside-diphosphate-sugar epimerase